MVYNRINNKTVRAGAASTYTNLTPTTDLPAVGADLIIVDQPGFTLGGSHFTESIFYPSPKEIKFG